MIWHGISWLSLAYKSAPIRDGKPLNAKTSIFFYWIHFVAICTHLFLSSFTFQMLWHRHCFGSCLSFRSKDLDPFVFVVVHWRWNRMNSFQTTQLWIFCRVWGEIKDLCVLFLYFLDFMKFTAICATKSFEAEILMNLFPFLVYWSLWRYSSPCS